MRTFTHRPAFAMALAAMLALFSAPLTGAALAEGQDVTIHVSKVDIAHGNGAEPIDQLDVRAMLSTSEASEACEAADSPQHGVVVSVQQGVCGSSAPSAQVTVPSFQGARGNRVARFEGETPEGAVADARVQRLSSPRSACGLFNLKVDAAPLDLSAITTGPVALTVKLADGSNGCVTVNNPIIDR